MWIISYFLKSKYESGLVDVIKHNTLNMIHVHDNENMQWNKQMHINYRECKKRFNSFILPSSKTILNCVKEVMPTKTTKIKEVMPLENIRK